MTGRKKQVLVHYCLVVWVALGSLGLFLPASPPARAAGEVEFINNLIDLDFPYSLTFSVTISAKEEVTSVALEYGTNAVSCVRSIARQPIDYVDYKVINAEWTWDFVDSGSLPMGAQIWWEWEVTLANGEVVRTPRQTSTIVDENYTWLQSGADAGDLTAVNVWYHDTSLSFVKSLAKIGQQALQRLQADFGVTPSRPVQVILYNNNEEVSNSGLYFTEWVGGYASPEYGIVVIGVEQGDLTWGEEVLTHELGHLISGELTHNCLSVSMPTWLSEGFSMYTEGGVARSQQDKVKNALRAGTLPPLRTLAAGFSASSAEATLSYAQSGMVFDYLFQQYGAEKVLALFAAIQSGTLVEDALRQVYDLDVDGLDNAWRASLGFAAQEPPPTPTGTPLPTPVPTLPLLAPYEASPTPPPTLAPATSTQPPAPPPPATSVAQAEAQPTPEESKGPALPCPGSSALFLAVVLAVLAPILVKKGSLP